MTQIDKDPQCRLHCCTDECDSAHPGHFIAAEHCRFRIHTGVGHFCVSTMGEYHPFGEEHPVRFDAIFGSGKLYETMVFDKRHKTDRLRYRALEIHGYDTADEARTGHARLIEKYRTELH